jgi:hypothetical protein
MRGMFASIAGAAILLAAGVAVAAGVGLGADHAEDRHPHDGATEPSAIKAALAVTRGFSGVTYTISHAPDRRARDKTVAMIEVRNGKLAAAGAARPGYVPRP